MTNKKVKFETQRFYPEIYLPEQLIEFSERWKEVIANRKYSFEEIKPVLDKEPVQPKFEVALLVFVPLIMSMIVFSIFKSLNSVLVFSLGWTVFYPIRHILKRYKYRRQVATFVDIKTKYLNYLKDYHSRKKINEESKDKFIQKLESNVEWANKQRIELNIEVFNKSRNAEIAYENPRLGKSEQVFEGFLRKVFGNLVDKNKVIEVFSYGYDDPYEEIRTFEEYSSKKKDNAYTPDFIIRHSDSGLKINIEIDEPYAKDKVIHHVNSKHDKIRNKYFNDNRWIILRFSEEQVVNYPLECCKEIATIISDFTNDSQFYEKLDGVDRLIRINKWDYSAAMVMIQNNFRDNYTHYSKVFQDIIGEWIIGDDIIVIEREIVKYYKGDKFHHSEPFQLSKSKDGRYLLNLILDNTTKRFIIERRNFEDLLLTNLRNRKYIHLKKRNAHNTVATTSRPPTI